MAEEAPDLHDAKHPYVTLVNAKVHLIFSIIIIILSVIQIIIGIAISEKVVNEVEWYMSSSNSYYSDEFEQYFYGDSIWIAFVGLILGALGLSVWKTRSRSNGIMLSIMLFISGFALYPTAGILAGAKFVWSGYPNEDAIINTRRGSAIFMGVQAIIVIGWAFYTSFHACCNSKVQKQRRIQMPGGGSMQMPAGAMGVQPQVVYVQQPGPGYIQQPGGFIQQPGGFVQAPGGYIQQPVYIAQPGYATGAQQQGYMMAGPQQQVFVAAPQQQAFVAGPPQYSAQQPAPGLIQQVEIPAQVQHGGGSSAPTLPGTPDTTPPAYSE